MDNNYNYNQNQELNPGQGYPQEPMQGQASMQSQPHESVQDQVSMQRQAQGTASGSVYSYSYINQGGQNAQNQEYRTVYEEPRTKGKEKTPRPKRKGGFGKTLAKCAAIALVFGLVSGTVFYGTGYAFDYATGRTNNVQASAKVSGGAGSDNGGKLTTTSTGTQAVVSDVSEVVDNVMPSIVAITNLSVQQVQSWFGRTYQREIPSAGSGIIIAQTEKELYIVTNNHVVSGADTLTVNFVDGETVAAEVKGTDPSTDLAVITVPVDDIPAETLGKIKVATLGNSDDLRVGEPAIAIGNALGYGQSVTTGVISALDREVTVTDQNNSSITNHLIQTDAAINPGNSGGALLNIKGEVIGINSVKYTDTDVEGMGYSIPISTADPIINDLISREAVDESKAAYLGINGVNVNDEVGAQFNMPNGIYLTQVVEGSPAAQAGIRPGDIISAFDGRSVSSMSALSERMKYYAAGTTVDVTLMVSENGEWVEKIVSVTLGQKN